MKKMDRREANFEFGVGVVRTSLATKPNPTAVGHTGGKGTGLSSRCDLDRFILRRKGNGTSKQVSPPFIGFG